MLLDILFEHRGDRLGDHGIEHLPFAHLMAAHQVEFELAEARCIDVAEIADPRHGRLLTEPHAPLPGARHDGLEVRDRKPGAHARLLVDELALAGRDRDLLEDLPHEVRHHDGPLAAQVDRRLLLGHLDAEVALTGIVGVDHRADPVLELRDHLPGAVVGGGIRGEEQHHVDVELHGIPADLHVALLENVEHPHLHEFVELRQLVHREDAAVHPGDEAEVKGLLARHARAAGELGRVDLADDVGELRARREPLGIAFLAGPPGDRDVAGIARRYELLSDASDRLEGIVVKRDRRVVEVGHVFVEEPHELPHEAALRLALLTEEQHVVPGEEGHVDLGDDGVVVAHDPRKELVARREHAEEVLAHFLLDGAALPAGGPKGGEGLGKRGGGGWHGKAPGND